MIKQKANLYQLTKEDVWLEQGDIQQSICKGNSNF